MVPILASSVWIAELAAVMFACKLPTAVEVVPRLASSAVIEPLAAVMFACSPGMVVPTMVPTLESSNCKLKLKPVCADEIVPMSPASVTEFPCS